MSNRLNILGMRRKLHQWLWIWGRSKTWRDRRVTFKNCLVMCGRMRETRTSQFISSTIKMDMNQAWRVSRWSAVSKQSPSIASIPSDKGHYQWVPQFLQPTSTTCSTWALKLNNTTWRNTIRSTSIFTHNMIMSTHSGKENSTRLESLPKLLTETAWTQVEGCSESITAPAKSTNSNHRNQNDKRITSLTLGTSQTLWE